MTIPSGTVTFLFTDIEGSTKLSQEHPEEMPALLARHNEILNQAIEAHSGYVFQIVGDSFSASFHSAADALNAALAAQRDVQNESWNPTPIKVRMGIHTGPAQITENNSYTGYATIALAQRVMSAGHGGQTLLSQTTHDLIVNNLPTGVQLTDMGMHNLKDVLQTQRLYQIEISGLPSSFPPLKTQKIENHNLPIKLTSFIGRERELAEAKKKLSEARLLTLIGPGGTGKTRLSLRVVADQLDKFKDGIWVIELASISNPDHIVSAMALVFNLREVQNIPLIEIVLDYLRAKQLLLIFDNCEHLVEGSAQIADQILHACSQVKIVASSREALGIEGESVFRVPSLPGDDATRLFVERATKAEPRFTLTEHNASIIAQICSRLDGIPLAIELAAARIKLFTPEQIAERLDDRFKLLTGGSRTALPRQQTLRALIDWSYISLSEAEQRAMRWLSVFSGGWTFDGAEAVIGEHEALDNLESLVNKSLVNVEEQESESRYRFLETIRQYAMEKLLDAGEVIEARDRHLDYVLQIAEQANESMFGVETKEWLDQMEMEHDNLRVALEWSFANHIEKAMKLALAIGGFWTSRDFNNESREWCRKILEASEGLENADQDRAKIYALLGWTLITTGNHKEGRAVVEKGLVLARKINDIKTILRLLSVKGLSSTFIGDLQLAIDTMEEAEKIARQANYPGELAMVLTGYAQVLYFMRRDYELSKQKLEEAIRLGKLSGFQWISSLTAYSAGRLAGNIGELETARVQFIESAEISRRFGNKRLVYSSRSELAHVLRENGELDEAYRIYCEIIPGWRELGHRAAIAHELECIGYILIKREEPERASTILGAAEALREVIDTQMTNIERAEYEKEVDSLHANMDEREFHQSWSKGRTLTMDEAIELSISPS